MSFVKPCPVSKARNSAIPQFTVAKGTSEFRQPEVRIIILIEQFRVFILGFFKYDGTLCCRLYPFVELFDFL